MTSDINAAVILLLQYHYYITLEMTKLTVITVTGRPLRLVIGWYG